MTNTKYRGALRTGIGSLLLSLLALNVGLAEPKPATRSVKQIGADIAAVRQDILQNANHDVTAKYNPEYRKQMNDELGPRYAHEAELYREFAAADPKTAPLSLHLAAADDACCAFWGNSDAAARIDARAADRDPVTAADGKAQQQMIAWYNAFGDADAQSKVIDRMESLAVANPTNDLVARSVHNMIFANPATLVIGQRLTDIVCIKLAKTPYAKAYAQQPNRIDEPLDFEGTTLKGKTFRLKDLRGKVVMVDFWATWCGPCVQELPNVAALYQQYHDKGFEIIGVSSDNDRVQLATFLKAHSEMPWQQLFSGGGGTAWHPLTKKFGIQAIPTMYLVDRNGNLRAVSEQSTTFKDLLPDLLAETYTPPPPPAKPVARPIVPIGK